MIASASQIIGCWLRRLFKRRSNKFYQSSALLAFVRGIHRWPVDSPHKGPITRKTLPFDDVIMRCWAPLNNRYQCTCINTSTLLPCHGPLLPTSIQVERPHPFNFPEPLECKQFVRNQSYTSIYLVNSIHRPRQSFLGFAQKPRSLPCGLWKLDNDWKTEITWSCYI